MWRIPRFSSQYMNIPTAIETPELKSTCEGKQRFPSTYMSGVYWVLISQAANPRLSDLSEYVSIGFSSDLPPTPTPHEVGLEIYLN